MVPRAQLGVTISPREAALPVRLAASARMVRSREVVMKKSLIIRLRLRELDGLAKLQVHSDGRVQEDNYDSGSDQLV